MDEHTPGVVDDVAYLIQWHLPATKKRQRRKTTPNHKRESDQEPGRSGTRTGSSHDQDD